VEPLRRDGVAVPTQAEDIMHKASPRPAARRATLDALDMVGLWSTALWILAAVVLLMTFRSY
jgi:hypothetical protein